MAEQFGFFDDVEDVNGNSTREYNSDQFNIPFKSLVTTGVMRGAYNQLRVTANGSNMITTEESGIAFVEGRHYFNDAINQLTHDTEVLGLNRIDRIVIRLDKNTEARHVKAFVKKGMPSATPVAPVLKQTDDVYEISLAQVRIVGGQTFISADAVTDERGTDNICPWAGSNILPNFDDQALEELVEKVDNMHELTDGAHAKTFVGDLNNLIEPGFYSVPGNTPNAPNNLPLLVEVMTSSNRDFVIQRATYDHLGTSTIPAFTRRAIKNTSGVLVWSTPSSGAVGFVGSWRVVDFILSDSINDSNTSVAATANAVKKVNDKLMSGYGNPEGVVSATLGTLYVNLNGGVSTTLYVKTSGIVGNTGWTAK